MVAYRDKKLSGVFVANSCAANLSSKSPLLAENVPSYTLSDPIPSLCVYAVYCEPAMARLILSMLNSISHVFCALFFFKYFYRWFEIA
jgi:hypothetical protein